MRLINATDNVLVDGLEVRISGSATGDLYYLDASGSFTRLPIGTAGQYLGVSGGIPAWLTLILALNSVTLGTLQQISSSSFLGRSSTGSGSVEELTPAAARLLLGLGSAALLAAGSAAGNVPMLDASGKLPTEVLPSLSLTSVQVVANQTARLALANVEVGDMAKETDTGLSYVLSALPASINSNWVTIGDTTITAADIISGLISTARLGGGTANSSSFLRGDQQWATLGNLATFFWVTQAVNVTMVPNTGYFANGTTAGTPVVLTLPASASVGAIIEVVGTGTAGWRIVQSSASHQIHFGRVSSTLGSAGYLASTHSRNAVRLVAISATVWEIISSQGALDCA